MATEPQENDDIGMEVEEGSDERTALLPIDFFQGKELKPGTVCKVKIARVLDGQAEVTYVPHTQEEPAPGEEIDEPDDAEMNEYMDV